MSQLQVHMFPCLQDNYGFLINDPETDTTGVVDTPEVKAILDALNETGWSLDYILNTHHHWDHAGGNLELKEQTNCKIVGPRADAARIPGIDIQVGDGDVFEFGQRKAVVYDTPGHTRGHIVYHFADDQIAFVGDTLFAMGCGRLFEGTPAQMWSSLTKLMANIPDDTKLYCAHEYTQGNARFALTVEPENRDLQIRAQEVDRLRADNQPTVPTTMAREKATNPFLRPNSANLQATLGMTGDDIVAVLAETRERKDHF